MEYLKSFFVGIGVASVSVLGYAVISFVRSYHWQEMGWGGFESVEISAGPFLLVLGLTAFVLGFFWMLLRTRTSH